MPLRIVRNDLTKMPVDAIVNASGRSLRSDGEGVSGMVHRAAGALLARACMKIGGCAVGDAVVTPGFGLPCKWVIHAVSPVWQGGAKGEEKLLAQCIARALALAKERGCRSVALPLIGAGGHGIPGDRALSTALGAIGDFLLQEEMDVYLVVFGRETLALGTKLLGEIREYIDDRYVEQHAPRGMDARRRRILQMQEERDACFETEIGAKPLAPEFLEDEKCAPRQFEPQRPAPAPEFLEDEKRAPAPFDGQRNVPAPEFFEEEKSAHAPFEGQRNAPAPEFFEDEKCAPAPSAAQRPIPAPRRAEPADGLWIAPGQELDDMLGNVGESFTQMLLRLIDERGMKDSTCYKRANIDRKLFSKIRSNEFYQPSKPTVLALSIALELSPDAARELLGSAGYAFSGASKVDIIVEYYLAHRLYDIHELNATLFTLTNTTL